MDITREIPAIKQLRKDTDDIIQRVRKLESCRETSLVITKLQEAVMWLGMDLKRINDTNPCPESKNPYPESKNPESMRIEPTADGLKM